MITIEVATNEPPVVKPLYVGNVVEVQYLNNDPEYFLIAQVGPGLGVLFKMKHGLYFNRYHESVPIEWHTLTTGNFVERFNNWFKLDEVINVRKVEYDLTFRIRNQS